MAEQISEVCRPILDGVYNLRNDAGNDASFVFQEPVDRRLVDYYRVIKRPMALSNIRDNLKANRYTNVSQFILDMAQITHNARVYNAPGSFIYTDAQILDRYLREQITKLAARQIFNPADLAYPDLGPLPDHSAALNGYDYESMDSMSDSDSDDDGSRRLRRRPMRKSVLLGRRKRQEEEEEEERSAVEGRKRRGRPPTVDKPHEHRIKAILRAIRRERDNETGRSLYLEFEKLPDPKLFADYYSIITEPMALDGVRKNIKRRKYYSVEAFLNDMNLIFNNAKQYNAETSQIYLDAVRLQQTLAAVADEELRKPDSAYQDPDSNSKTSRLPLDSVEHRGETYKVGDWVHLSNANDPAKPIVGQIFRLWQEGGEQWVNVCWYYRPEQTVHRYDKLFYENEVMKSGQYRDQKVEEILEKCFVMYITKYQRGRPQGIGQRSVYCCESRYNEAEKTFNKIRTWKACIPDEVRSTDYPMDLFERPRPLRRVISPIKHLLPADAKDTDPMPEPKMGAPNAPPIVGGVYKRPIDPNDPPEQPTPQSPPSAPRSASPAGGPGSTASAPGTVNGGSGAGNGSGVGSNPAMRYAAVSGASTVGSSHATTPTPGPMPIMASAAGSGMIGTPLDGGMPPPMSGAGAGAGYGGPPVTMPSAYALSEAVVGDLPAKQTTNVAKLKDGQILWFPSCPVWVSHRILSAPLPPAPEFGLPRTGLTLANGIGFSAKYLAWKNAQKEA